MKTLALALALFGAACAEKSVRTVSVTMIGGCINVGVSPFCQGIGNGTRQFIIGDDKLNIDAGFKGDSSTATEVPGCTKAFDVWANVTSMIFGMDNCLYTGQSEFMGQCCTDPPTLPVPNPYFSCYGPGQNCVRA